MVRHKIFYYILLTALLGCTHLFAQSFPPPKPLTDEEQIRLVLQDIKDAIISQNLLRLMDCFHYPLEYGDSTAALTEVRDKFTRVFNRSGKRWEDSLFQAVTPQGGDLTGTWDFELEIDGIRILNDHTALVKAWIYFGASPPDVKSKWQFGKKHRENFLLKKIGGEWGVKNVGKLFKILRRFGSV